MFRLRTKTRSTRLIMTLLLRAVSIGVTLLTFVVELVFLTDTVEANSDNAGIPVETHICSVKSLDQEHWFSASWQNEGDRVPDQCLDCRSDPNREDPSCYVDHFLRSEKCRSSFCEDEQGQFMLRMARTERYALQRDLRYTLPQEFPRAADENCRFIIWALDPIIGVEDPSSAALVNYWELAFAASQNLIEPALPVDRIGLVLQSALTRGQHQFHIHIGTITDPYRSVLRTLKRTPNINQVVDLGGRAVTARFIPDVPGSPILSNFDPIEVVRSMLPGGGKELPLSGILVARAPEGDASIVFTARALAREELNFKQSVACSFKPKNTTYGSEPIGSDATRVGSKIRDALTRH